MHMCCDLRRLLHIIWRCFPGHKISREKRSNSSSLLPEERLELQPDKEGNELNADLKDLRQENQRLRTQRNQLQQVILLLVQSISRHSDTVIEQTNHAPTTTNKGVVALPTESLYDSTTDEVHKKRIRGLHAWFSRMSLRDLKIVLALYDANKEYPGRDFSLHEIAIMLQMSPHTAREKPIHHSLFHGGLIRQSRHGRAGYRYQSLLTIFLQEQFPQEDPHDLIPLLFNDQLIRRGKKSDIWLNHWLQEQKGPSYYQAFSARGERNPSLPSPHKVDC